MSRSYKLVTAWVCVGIVGVGFAGCAEKRSKYPHASTLVSSAAGRIGVTCFVPPPPPASQILARRRDVEALVAEFRRAPDRLLLLSDSEPPTTMREILRDSLHDMAGGRCRALAPIIQEALR